MESALAQSLRVPRVLFWLIRLLTRDSCCGGSFEGPDGPHEAKAGTLDLLDIVLLGLPHNLVLLLLARDENPEVLPVDLHVVVRAGVLDLYVLSLQEDRVLRLHALYGCREVFLNALYVTQLLVDFGIELAQHIVQQVEVFGGAVAAAPTQG